MIIAAVPDLGRWRRTLNTSATIMCCFPEGRGPRFLPVCYAENNTASATALRAHRLRYEIVTV